MALFVSTFFNKIDIKGRVSVPASFRTTVTMQMSQGIFIYPSFTANAIDGCCGDFLEQLVTSTTLDFFSSEQDDINTLIFSSAHHLTWDSEGRVVLPKEIREHANITEQVAFVGKGRTFQIWEPIALKIHTEKARNRALQNRPKITLHATENK
ncbi:MAG: division/cell wall cluster transcriptional repressor MraZ [Rhodospirillaceae bacterium]|jgi:MraZ protein|nr:division/cell wall cluster transcriptional repressor MraZ [Rhodospirillaceae bacterium]